MRLFRDIVCRCLARGDVKSALAVIDRAAVAVRVELNHTASICADCDTDEIRIRLSFTAAEAVAVGVHNVAALRIASESERQWTVRAVLQQPPSMVNVRPSSVL